MKDIITAGQNPALADRREALKPGKIIGKIFISILLITIAAGVSFFALPFLNKTGEDNGRIQQQLTGKLAQVTGIWATVKVASGVISVVQTIQVEGSIPVVGGLAVSAQPLGWAKVIDNILDKISNILLWAMGAIAIEKLLLAISWWVSIKVIVPICALFVIIAMWSNKYKERLKKIVAGIIIIGAGICSAVPLSLELSNVVETSILSSRISNTINELEVQSGEIEKEGNDINNTSFFDRLRRLGSGIVNFFGGLKQKFDSFIESAINYIMCFIVTNLIIPIATIIALKYLVGITLKFTGFTEKGETVIRYLPQTAGKLPITGRAPH
jgi:hypothetical protein